jgi:hypothetical protein
VMQGPKRRAKASPLGPMMGGKGKGDRWKVKKTTRKEPGWLRKADY